MNKLVVLTDLGTFKAFALEENRLNSSPRLQPVDSTRMEEGDDRLSRRVTDQAGQFSKGATIFASINDQSNGERHNIWLEDQRRSVRQIAERMSALLNDGRFESCYFAAASEINNSIIDQLPAEARAKIHKNVRCNLVNASRDEILHKFAS
jgi:hypothetical protein